MRFVFQGAISSPLLQGIWDFLLFLSAVRSFLQSLCQHKKKVRLSPHTLFTSVWAREVVFFKNVIFDKLTFQRFSKRFSNMASILVNY